MSASSINSPAPSRQPPPAQLSHKLQQVFAKARVHRARRFARKIARQFSRRHRLPQQLELPLFP